MHFEQLSLLYIYLSKKVFLYVHRWRKSKQHLHHVNSGFSYVVTHFYCSFLKPSYVRPCSPTLTAWLISDSAHLSHTILPYRHFHLYTHMCSVETWLRPWASWEARFSSRQPSRQVTSSAILPLYRRLLVVVAGRGEGRGSWFNTATRRERLWWKGQRWGDKENKEKERHRIKTLNL